MILIRRALLDALESRDPQAVEKTVWRVVRKGRDPLRGAVADGRWNAISEFEVLYAGLAAEGALAEVGYRLSLEPVWPSKIEHEVHTLAVKADRAVVFDDLQDLEKLGVNAAKFQTFDYAATQAIAAAARFLEFDALVVPSARYAVLNLVGFLERLRTPPQLIHTDTVNWTAWRARTRRR